MLTPSNDFGYNTYRYIGLHWNGNEYLWHENNIVDEAWLTERIEIPPSFDNQRYCLSVDFRRNSKWIATNCSEVMPYICRKAIGRI